MSLPVKTGLPLGFVAQDGYTLKWRAVDPTTGADVSGVVISSVAIQADPLDVPAGTKLEPVYEMPGLETAAPTPAASPAV